MIEQVYVLEDFVPGDYFGRRLLAQFEAYGAEYDFCRFYRFSNGEKSALLCAFNDSLTVAGTVDSEEFSLFLKALSPAYVEGAGIEKIDGYKGTKRRLFQLESGVVEDDFLREMTVEINPPLDTIYDILKQGFSIPFDAWLTDTSHRVRHGKATIFRYKSTIVVEKFCVNSHAFYCQLVTALADRGTGQARELLAFVASRARARGSVTELLSEGERFGFYEEIGAVATAENVFFQREE